MVYIASLSLILLSTTYACAPEFSLYEPTDTCFYFEKNFQHWTDSQKNCQGKGEGFDLATSKNAFVNRYIQDQSVTLFGDSEQMWIGLYYDGSTFRWVDGDVMSYNNFQTGGDDISTGNNHVVLNSTTGKWTAISDFAETYSVCSGPNPDPA